ncbi:MAG: bifunctional 5,10-methylenetetrahydrofolate dehydrogenase/5,10-methenyltetrahydrofolate cyclohydrolase [Phoenicibacter congonensis]|uniref:Bifunctional protein FolD n=1 Tax=Phoenicibacter congonensis TaxID=1944646 RepID=A0AA43RJA6_9ACTN|nr:bifunctional 5,10-methylenetetrahydrofolate dehydrogenase/5,10-methenyltetrahydrofolate cyclohydrolase [Phoenicibacter congonensis]
MAELLLGKPVADAIYAKVDSAVENLKQNGVEPTLALVLVGNDPASESYEKSLVKKAEEHGIKTELFNLEQTVTQEEFEATIDALNNDDSIHGCLFFQPLPHHLDVHALQTKLDPAKDIDCITEVNSSKVYSNADLLFVPATAQSCLEILDHYGIDVTGKHVVVAGRSLVIGRPVSVMLLHRNATVTMTHSKSKKLKDLTSAADIVILATGRANAFGKNYFAPGQVVIDVATNVDEAGKLTGDVDFDEVEPIVDSITPVPRGVGSVTTSVMLQFVCSAAAHIAGLK